MSRPVSRYFTERDVARSSVAARYGIDNTPTDEVIEAAKPLAVNVLDPIREQFGPFTPSSWYRCSDLERVICEKHFLAWAKQNRRPPDDIGWLEYLQNKSHPRGEAADCEVAGVANDALFAWIRENLKFDQLIREFAKSGDPWSGWVHVSYRETGNRQQILNIG